MCIMLPTSKVLIIFTFIKFITWAFKVSKTLLIKDQVPGSGVLLSRCSRSPHCTVTSIHSLLIYSVNQLAQHHNRGRIWSLPLSTPHLLASPERIFLQLLLPYPFHPALHTQPGPSASGLLLWSQSSKDTSPLLKVPRRALQILHNITAPS